MDPEMISPNGREPSNNNAPIPWSAGPMRPGFDSPRQREVDSTYGRTGNWSGETLDQFGAVLWRRKWTLLGITALFVAAALLLTRAQTAVYRAMATVEIQDLNEDFLNTRSVTRTADSSPYQSPEYNIRTQTMILQSRPVIERAVEKNGIESRLLATADRGSSGLPWGKQGPVETSHDRAISLLEAQLKTRVEPSTRAVEVSFDSTDPQLAADVVNSVASSFSEISLERRSQSSKETSQWLSKQMDDLNGKLQSEETRLQQFASNANLTILGEKDDPAEQRLLELQTELSRAQADRATKQSRYEQAGRAAPESLPEVLDDPTLKEYQVQLTALWRQLAEMSTTLTQENPKVVNVKAQISTLETVLEQKRANILTRLQNEYASAVRREKLVDADYASQVAFVTKESGKLTRYSDLKRDVDATRQLKDAMTQRIREAGLAAAMQASDIRVIEPAFPPTSPRTPNPLLNGILGLFAGLCAGSVFLIYRAREYHGIREPGQVTVELNLPELGVIPAGNAKCLRPRLAGAARGQSELATLQQWPSVMGESFRLTLTSILLSEKNGTLPNVIAFTSAKPGEGKTTVVSNLAIAFARIGRRVLLIDGDVRKPRLHEIFSVDNRVGLSDALEPGAKLPIHATEVPNLSVLPSGGRTDERLFFTSRVGLLLRRLKPDYDMILIDTPPLLLMSDARLLSHYADAAILVVAQHTDRDDVALAQQQLSSDGTPILGSILNRWNPGHSRHPTRHIENYRQYGNYIRASA